MYQADEWRNLLSEEPAVLIVDWCLISHPSVGVSVRGEPQEDLKLTTILLSLAHSSSIPNTLSGSTFSQTVFTLNL